MRHTADGRYCPVKGSGLSVGALTEVAENLAPWSRKPHAGQHEA